VGRRAARRLKSAALAATLLASLGCGYRVVELRPPPGVRRVAVRSFAPGPATPRLGGLVAQAIALELTAGGRVALAVPAAADAVVTGEIRALDARAESIATRPEGARAALARMEIVVVGSLTSADGRVLRRAGPFRLGVLRPVAASADPDLLLEDRALRALAADAARRIVRALFR